VIGLEWNDNYFISFKQWGTIVDWDFTNHIHCLTWREHHRYAETTVYPEHKNISMHRMLMGFPDSHIDHINHMEHDNRMSNLREVTHQENHNNRRDHGIWPVGVYYHKRDKRFVSRIRINNKRFELGRFNDPISAGILYEVAKDDIL